MTCRKVQRKAEKKMSDTKRLERLEQMVDLIAGATIVGCAFAPVLDEDETRELVRLRLALRATWDEQRRRDGDVVQRRG